MIHMDSIPLGGMGEQQCASSLQSLYHVAHFTGTAFRIQEDEILIEGYSGRMVELAKQALHTSLAALQQAPGGGGAAGAAHLVQQAAIASTSESSDWQAAAAGTSGGASGLARLSGLVCLDEETVSSTTEGESVTPIPRESLQPGALLFLIGGLCIGRAGHSLFISRFALRSFYIHGSLSL